MFVVVNEMASMKRARNFIFSGNCFLFLQHEASATAAEWFLLALLVQLTIPFNSAFIRHL